MTLLRFLIISILFASTACLSSHLEKDKYDEEVILEEKFKMSVYQKMDESLSKDLIYLVFSINYIGNNPIDFTDLEYQVSSHIEKSFNWFKCNVGGENQAILNVTPIQYFGTAPKIDFLISLSQEFEKGEKIELFFEPDVKDLRALSCRLGILLNKL